VAVKILINQLTVEIQRCRPSQNIEFLPDDSGSELSRYATTTLSWHDWNLCSPSF